MDFPRSRGRIDIVERSDKVQEFLTGHTRPGGRFIWDIPDEGFGFERFFGGIVLTDGDDSLIRAKETDDHFEESCLAGAVRSDQGKDFSLSDRKTDIVDGSLLAEALGDVVKDKHNFFRKKQN